MQYNYSIIIPYRDKYDLFLKAVESIPDREDVQIILVDNAPQPLQKQQLPVKKQAHVDYTTSSPTKGAGCARNVGLKHIEGKWVLFLDADDYFTDEAFAAFDNYLDSTCDIIFFRASSIYLENGTESDRHIVINSLVSRFFETANEDLLRYRFVNPVSKMFRAVFLKENAIIFEEIPVSNDVWFSVTSGHVAKTITADNTSVYMITEGTSGSSLTKRRSKENWFIRYKEMVRVNKFLKSVGKDRYRIRLIGAMRITLHDFGLIECARYLKYAYDNKVSIF